MKIGLFGAAFDPPHLGHQHLIAELLKANLVDQVWVVPVKSHPFAKPLSPVEHRLAMVKLMLAALQAEGWGPEQVRLETYELDQPGVSYSYQTLQYFAGAYPDHTFSWIIGADNVANFAKWHHYQELLAQHQVLIYPRPGYGMEPLLPGMVPLDAVTPMAASSTEARKVLAEAASDTTKLVLPEVAQYSKQHQLY